MNRDELEGKAEQLKGKIKQAAGDLTDDRTSAMKAWRTRPPEPFRKGTGRPIARSARPSRTSAKAQAVDWAGAG